MIGLAREFAITYDEESVHNMLTISGNDPELFSWADPEIMYGEPRIEAVVGNRAMRFIIDSRDGEKTDFTITCLSVSAKEDSPYAAEIDFQLDTPTLASEVAASLATYCPVQWEADDWVVPENFSFQGTPLHGIVRLAEEIGAVVRCQDDGSLLVRKRRPVRPVDMPHAKTDVFYDRSNMIVLSHSETPESGYNAVRVTGLMPETFIPQMALEPIVNGDSTRSPVIGETCRVRVYWAGHEPSVISTYVTSGLITPVGGGAFYTEIKEEVVEFNDGMASVGLPIFELISYEWIGDDGGQIEFIPHSNHLNIGAGKFRVARVKYRTRFVRYQLEKHNVERLIAVLFLTVDPAVSVFVRTSSSPVEGRTIDAPLLSSEHAAVARAVAWIDQQYRKSICEITVPYSDLAVDGKIAFIDDSHIGSPGNYHIVRSEIQIQGPMTVNRLRLEKCLTSFNS